MIFLLKEKKKCYNCPQILSSFICCLLVFLFNNEAESMKAATHFEAIASTKDRFVVVSFGSLGPPFDDGLDLREVRDRLTSLVTPHADAFYMFSPADLANDSWWGANFQVYPDTVEWMLPGNPGAHKVGYWKYKPLLLYRAMENEPEGTIIMYMDSNIQRHSNLEVGVTQWRNVSRYVLEENLSGVWLGYEDPGASRVKEFCKGYAVRKISDPRFTNYIFERSLLVANRIVLRNTQFVRKMFWDELLPLFTDDSILANYPQDGAHKDLIRHTGDQAIWNAYFFNQQYLGKLDRSWPKFAYIKRARSFTFEGLEPWNDEEWEEIDNKTF